MARGEQGREERAARRVERPTGSKRLGALLRVTRGRRTQREVVREMEARSGRSFSQSWLSNIERGFRPIAIDDLALFAEVVGVSLAEVLPDPPMTIEELVDYLERMLTALVHEPAGAQVSIEQIERLRRLFDEWEARVRIEAGQ